jgi:hypothetical protein
MAIMDKMLVMCDNQSLVTLAGGTIYGNDIIDFGHANPDKGHGTPLWVHALVGTRVRGNGAFTLRAQLFDSDNGSTFNTLPLIDTGTIQSYNLLSGMSIINQPLPADCRRYLRIQFTVGTTQTTAGTVDAWIDLNSMNSKRIV